VAGVHDYLNLWPQLLNLFQCLDAVHSGHFLVQDDDLGILVPYKFDGILTVAGIQDLEIPYFQLAGQ